MNFAVRSSMRLIQFLEIAPVYFLTGCVVIELPLPPISPSSPRVENPTTNTKPARSQPRTAVESGSDIEYLSSLEKGIIDETNKARQNPAAYAAQIEKWKPYFDGNLLKMPGEIPL